jgi:hypothetical protein
MPILNYTFLHILQLGEICIPFSFVVNDDYIYLLKQT